MQKTFSIDDIDENKRDKIFIQDYSPNQVIEGIKIIELKNHIGEEGDFCELIRLNNQMEVEGIAGFKIFQINRTKIYPKAIKAWHLHFLQDEIWYVPPSNHLMVGLWDLRKESKTNNITMRVLLGGGASKLLYIPRGVAHGCSNFYKKSTELFYFVSSRFDINNPDERRLNWDILGSDFWSPKHE